MGRAPYGYMNRNKENGRKYIAVNEQEASALRWAFNEIAKGVLAADQVRQEMNKYINRYVDLMFVVHDRRDSQGILWYYSFIKQNKEVLAKKKGKQNKTGRGREKVSESEPLP